MHLVVKHTFLEYVDTLPEATFGRTRSRARTDSELLADFGDGSNCSTSAPGTSDGEDDNSVDPLISLRYVPPASDSEDQEEQSAPSVAEQLSPDEAKSPESSPWTVQRAAPPEPCHDVEFDPLPPPVLPVRPVSPVLPLRPASYLLVPVYTMDQIMSVCTTCNRGPQRTCEHMPRAIPTRDYQHMPKSTNLNCEHMPRASNRSCERMPRANNQGFQHVAKVCAGRPVARPDEEQRRVCFDEKSNATIGGGVEPAVIRDMESKNTTVMVRNLEIGYTRDRFMDLIDSEGFAGIYIFVYLPVDFSSGRTLGYAFVDFPSPCLAITFFRHFDGFTKAGLTVGNDGPCLTATWSDPHQGIEQQIERYRNSPVMHESVPDDWKPVLMVDGVRVEFPAPTRRIKAPKIRDRSGAKGGSGHRN